MWRNRPNWETSVPDRNGRAYDDGEMSPTPMGGTSYAGPVQRWPDRELFDRMQYQHGRSTYNPDWEQQGWVDPFHDPLNARQAADYLSRPGKRYVRQYLDFLDAIPGVFDTEAAEKYKMWQAMYSPGDFY